jgi:hypothetical protein
MKVNVLDFIFMFEATLGCNICLKRVKRTERERERERVENDIKK